MGSARHRRPVCLWAILLLGLAASPITTPFSSCDLRDFLSDPELQEAGILQIKPAKDEAGAALMSAPVGFLPAEPARRSFWTEPSWSGEHPAFQTPLRL